MAPITAGEATISLWAAQCKERTSTVSILSLALIKPTTSEPGVLFLRQRWNNMQERWRAGLDSQTARCAQSSPTSETSDPILTWDFWDKNAAAGRSAKGSMIRTRTARSQGSRSTTGLSLPKKLGKWKGIFATSTALKNVTEIEFRC